MNIKNILFFALFLAALGSTYVYFDGKVKGLRNEISELTAQLQTTKSELQNKTLNLGVYMAQHGKKDETLDKLRHRVRKLKTELARYKTDGDGTTKGKALVAKLAGMTEQDIKDLMGKPASKLGPKSEWWYYNAEDVIDEEAGTTYRSVQILFANGVVSKVTLKH